MRLRCGERVGVRNAVELNTTELSRNVIVDFTQKRCRSCGSAEMECLTKPRKTRVIEVQYENVKAHFVHF